MSKLKAWKYKRFYNLWKRKAKTYEGIIRRAWDIMEANHPAYDILREADFWKEKDK